MPHEMYQRPMHEERRTIGQLAILIKRGADRLPSPLPIERDAMRVLAHWIVTQQNITGNEMVDSDLIICKVSDIR